MRVLAIDPGNERSAYVVFDSHTKKIHEHATGLNYWVLDQLPRLANGTHHMAIEMIACYGMPVGKEVFETCVWIGRFIQAWKGTQAYVYRRDVKLHLCNSAKAKDANVRKALIDRFGAPGTKKKQGATYGIKGDEWAALGVAVTWADEWKRVGDGGEVTIDNGQDGSSPTATSEPTGAEQTAML